MVPHDKVITGLDITGGTTKGFALAGTPRQGTLRKLRVVQTSGSFDGFSYVLYNSISACDDAGAAASGVDDRLYRLTTVYVVASTKHQLAADNTYPEAGVTELSIPYRLQDDRAGVGLAANPSSVGGALRLKIIAAGSGAKTFAVAITVDVVTPIA